MFNKTGAKPFSAVSRVGFEGTGVWEIWQAKSLLLVAHKNWVCILKSQEATVCNSFLKLWSEAIQLPDAKEIIEAVSGTKPHKHRHSKPARLSPCVEAHTGDSTVWQERERLKIHIQTLSGPCQQMASGCLLSPLCLCWHKVASHPSTNRGGRGLLSHYWVLASLCALTAPLLAPAARVSQGECPTAE